MDAQAAEENAPLTWRNALGIGGRASIRTMGLGAVDTAVLLMSGDAIETMLASSLNLTTLGAVGVGSIISSVLGLAFGGYLEVLVNDRLPPMDLSAAQLERPLARHADLVGACLGVVIGCLVGFLPIIAQGKFFRTQSKQACMVASRPAAAHQVRLRSPVARTASITASASLGVHALAPAQAPPTPVATNAALFSLLACAVAAVAALQRVWRARFTLASRRLLW